MVHDQHGCSPMKTSALFRFPACPPCFCTFRLTPVRGVQLLEEISWFLGTVQLHPLLNTSSSRRGFFPQKVSFHVLSIRLLQHRLLFKIARHSSSNHSIRHFCCANPIMVSAVLLLAAFRVLQQSSRESFSLHLSMETQFREQRVLYGNVRLLQSL